MATITTTTVGVPFDYPSQSYMALQPNDGSLWVLVPASTANTYELWRSDDGGASWVLRASVTRANIVEYSGIQITQDGWLHWCYRTNEGNQDRIYYRRCSAFTIGSTWQAEKLVASPSNGGVAGAYHTGLDFALERSGSADTTYVCIAVGTQVGANQGVTCYALTAKPENVVTINNGLIAGTRQWLSPGTGRVGVSADKEHIGDGITRSSSSPHVWVAWGRTSARMVKLSWSGGKWNGPTAPVVLVSSLPAQDSLAARWDGARWLVAVPDPAVTDTVLVLERNQANTETKTRNTPPHPTGVIRNCGINYNTSTGDLRVYAVGTSTAVLYYVDYVRATGLWTSWAQVTSTAILAVNSWGVRPATAGPARYDVYTAHAGSPNTLAHTRQVVAYPPSTPVWNAASSPFASSGAASVSAALLLDWDFIDADPADTQSAWALSRQIGTGSLAYFRASDSTWQASEQKNTGSTTAVSLAAGWGSTSDQPHTYKVKVWDASDLASQYSAGLGVVPSQPASPTITAPTAAQVLTADTVTVTWTVAEQSAYRVTLAYTSGGQLHDSGWQTGTATSYTPPVSLADGGAYTVTVRTQNNQKLASAQVTRSFTVDYVEPPAPSTAAVALPALGAIRVTITNPAPSGGQPDLSSQSLYRRRVGESGDGALVASGLASGAVVDDWRASSGVPYEYRAVVRAVNGTSSFGTWTP
ncbi:hypothetical protein [Micromonospora aurantiaca (nom. illeg.)]|uniref:hypothetical protein n=1 Tax=Micromonospora aurantiaca (nom. illeg.) TaxID=47850 RepID=UPI003EC1272E